MTISEFSKIVAALKTVYTSPGFIPNEPTLDMWYRLVGKNNDYQTMSVAAQMYMTTGKFPPTPADILECASKLKAESSYLSEQEAWATVAKACTNGEWIEGGYSYQKNFDRLPKILQKAVGTPETLRNWSQVDMATMQTVARSTKGDRQVPAEAPRDDTGGGGDRAKRNSAGTTHTGRNSWAVRAG